MSRSERLRNIFLISLMGLVCLAGGVLTWLDGNFFPVGMTFPIAIGVYIFCEHLQWFRLGNLGANILGIIALIAAAMEFLGEGQEAKLLAGVHLLCYVQWILLMQEKEDSQYWWNVVLTILQMAVCAVLTYDIWFGIWLILYVALVIWTLSVYWMYQAETQFRESERISLENVSTSATGGIVNLGGWSESEQLKGAADQSASVSSSVTNSVQIDAEDNWISWRFLGGVTAMSVAVILMGGVVFASIPRVWSDAGIFGNEFSAAARGAMPGFSNRVQLNDVSSNADNPRTVFRVVMYDAADSAIPRDRRPKIDISKYSQELGMIEPLFRGAVLASYSQGEWRPHSEPDFRRVWNFNRSDPTSVIDYERGVIQEIEMEPIETRTLFSLGAVQSASSLRRQSVDVEFDIHSHELRWTSDGDVRQGFRYLLVTARSKDRPSNPNKLIEVQGPTRETLSVPEGLAGLSARAWEIIGRDPESDRGSESTSNGRRFRLSVEETERRIQVLQNHLRESGQYGYSLTAAVVDPALDPVEDFVLNRKAGHCEYFASALALMLRSVNVHSRVITGFKGGISKPPDPTLTVLQRNAHAWVEAYVGGRWVTLDPTPGIGDQQLSESDLSLWETGRRLISDTWSNYVVNMTIEDQNGVAVPVMESFRRRLNDGTFPEIVKWIVQVILTPRLWLSWEGGAVLLIIGGVLLSIRFIAYLVKRVGGKILVTLTSGETARSSGVDFYEKFLGLMARRGLRPYPWQTQREFASVSLNQVPVPQPAGLAGLIARCFYQVRFGGEALSESTKEEVTAKLDQLELELKEEAAKKTAR